MSGMTATVAAYTGEDTDLVAAVRRGDDRAFETLYQRYHTRIAAYVRGMVKDHARAEDVTQEVFFSALRRMRDTERPIAFKPWIYEIARNACIDAYRRTSRADELSYDADGGLGAGDHLRLVSQDPQPDAAVESKQTLDNLCGAFGGLSETHHQILVLRELEGLSYREIGERLGMSRPAVESTLFRARRRLTEEYDELISGRRCERVQSIISAASEGMLGVRDRRRLARHTATCQTCRRHARLVGLEDLAPTSVSGRLAALLPIPAFLRRGADGASAAAGHGSSMAAQLSSSLAAAGDPVAAGLTKAVAAAAILAFAGAGAHVAAQHGHALPGLGGAPVVGKAGQDAALRAVHGSTSTVTAERLLPRSRASSTTVAAPEGAAKASKDSTSAAGTRTTASHEAAATHAAADGPAVSAPATPSAPSTPDPGVKLPLGSGSGSGTRPSGPSGGAGGSSGVKLPDVKSVTSGVGAGASAPSAPSTPPVDVRSVVSAVTGSGS